MKKAIAITFTLLIFIFCCIVSTLVFAFTFKYNVNQIVGNAMSPALIENDSLIIEKTNSDTKIERGQVITFRAPDGHLSVQRVIALPGEKVKIKNGMVLINGKLLKEKYLAPGVTTSIGDYMVAGREYELSANNYFVLGDNRDNSDDSRFNKVKFVERSNIVGIAKYILFPSSKTGEIKLGEYELTDAPKMDDGKTFSIEPAVKYIDNAKPGETLKETVKISTAGNYTLGIKDFDINRTDCTDRVPKIGVTSGNSASKWVTITNPRPISTTAGINLDIKIPADAEKKTYWFAFSVSSAEKSSDLKKELASLFFITVGEKRTEKCLVSK